MPSLKEYRNRIASVKSTRKITSAMKMVAASKLRRAQMQAEASQPYASRMADMLSRLAANIDVNESSPFLIAGSGKDDVHLLVVITSDRGLCGGFNGSVVRMAKQKIRDLTAEGKEVRIVCVGRKGHDALKREYSKQIVKKFEGLGRKSLSFAEAQQVALYILEQADARSFDVCTLVYNRFKSVISQVPSTQQLIPFKMESAEGADDKEAENAEGVKSLYEFEPSEEKILEELLPKNLSVQVFRSMLDSAAGEQAARMTAMDNATRNAGDMIDGLTLSYNRARQAYITKELIEIISGAEAV